MRKLTVTELQRPSVEEFKRQPKTPIVVVLDNVRSALNVGSAFRTADAFAIEKIMLCGITAQPPNKEISKTALGATESVEWEYEKDPIDVIKKLKLNNYKIIAIEQAEGGILLQNFDLQQDYKYALVFGNEVNGVSDTVMEIADTAIEIPQFGTKHSLNISVCIGIVVWELFRKLKFKS
ncbi:MAG: RNA methyltransferase [Saprospiraceae bacterium]|nr:RNA methyltransferase [Saprospiraceae bacterium]